jgi:hypothetical protein
MAGTLVPGRSTGECGGSPTRVAARPAHACNQCLGFRRRLGPVLRCQSLSERFIGAHRTRTISQPVKELDESEQRPLVFACQLDGAPRQTHSYSDVAQFVLPLAPGRTGCRSA